MWSGVWGLSTSQPPQVLRTALGLFPVGAEKEARGSGGCCDRQGSREKAQRPQGRLVAPSLQPGSTALSPPSEVDTRQQDCGQALSPGHSPSTAHSSQLGGGSLPLP